MPDTEMREPLPGEPLMADDPYFELIAWHLGPLAVCKGCGGVTFTALTQSGDVPWLRHFRTCVPLRMKFGLPDLPREEA